MSAEEHLNKLDIWNHPRITDRNEKESYDVAEIMESYALEYHAKEMERKLEEAAEEITKIPDFGLEALNYPGAKWLLNHLKQQIKSKH